jgi:deoxyribonuclease V
VRIRALHPWDVTPKEAARIQAELRGALVHEDALDPPRLVAGADIALDKREKLGFGGVVVHALPTLEEVERATAVVPLTFPYVPGLLAFREAPVLLEVFAKLRSEPDVAVFDAHGLAHPRRMGLACHMGLLLDRPTIGCAKSVLVGEYDMPPPEAGTWTPLVHEGETVGAAVRTRDRVKPVFVSTGHRISLETAIEVMLACRDGTRIPKPTREADRLVGQLKRDHLAGMQP